MVPFAGSNPRSKGALVSRLRRPTLPNRRPPDAPPAPSEAAGDAAPEAAAPIVGTDPPGRGEERSWSRRLWHLLWIAPLLGSAAVIAAPPDRLGPAPQILAFEVQPAAARPGEAVTLSWSVDGAETVRIDPLPGREVAAVGRQTVPAPEGSTTFQLTVTGFGHTRTANVQLQVAPAPPEIMLFEAQPTEIAVGEAAMLAWNVSGDDVVVQIEPGDGSQLGANGSILLYPNASTTYSLIAKNAVGQTSALVAVSVGGLPAPAAPEVRRFEIVATTGTAGGREGGTATADGGEGGTVVLGWSVTGAETIELDGAAAVTGLAADGEIEVAALEWTAVYRLIVRGPGGTTVAELTVPGTADDGARAQPTPPVVVRPILSGDPNVAAPPPDGVNSGNLVDSVVADQGGDAYAEFAPNVEQFEVSPAYARLGDEVIVRWVVGGADQVAVRFDPSAPGTEPLTAHAGVYRFVATRDVNVVLEATNVVGSIVRRQITFSVRPFAPDAVGIDLAAGLPHLLVAGEGGAGSALVTERSGVWIFRQGDWRYGGALPSLTEPPVAAAMVGQTLVAVAADGRAQTISLAGVARPTSRMDPWRATTATGAFDVRPFCAKPISLAGFSVLDEQTGADQGGTLVLACAEPAQVQAYAVNAEGAIASAPHWIHELETAPAAMVGTPRPGTGDGTLAVRYPPISGLGARVDLLAASVGWIGMVTASGPVTAAAPSPDGNVAAVAVFGEPAIHVLDRRGWAARRIEVDAEVSALSWQAAIGWQFDGGEIPRLAPLAPDATPMTGGAPAPNSEGVAPPPVPRAGDADTAATRASPGWLLVTWKTQPGGALINLAPWSGESPLVARLLPDRALLALVDDGGAIVGVSRSPSRASAFPWLTAGAPAGRPPNGGGP